MGNGASTHPDGRPFANVQEAIEAGKTQEEIDAYLAAKQAVETKPIPVSKTENLAVVLMFKQVDADNNGLIDMPELKELFATLGFLEEEVGPLAATYMEKFDTGGSKELDKDMFVKLYGSLKAAEGPRLAKYSQLAKERKAEAERRLANRVARAKDPDFDKKQEEAAKQAAKEKTLQRAATKKEEKAKQAAASDGGDADAGTGTGAGTATTKDEKPAAAAADASAAADTTGAENSAKPTEGDAAAPAAAQ